MRLKFSTEGPGEGVDLFIEFDEDDDILTFRDEEGELADIGGEYANDLAYFFSTVASIRAENSDE